MKKFLERLFQKCGWYSVRLIKSTAIQEGQIFVWVDSANKTYNVLGPHTSWTESREILRASVDFSVPFRFRNDLNLDVADDETYKAVVVSLAWSDPRGLHHAIKIQNHRIKTRRNRYAMPDDGMDDLHRPGANTSH